MSTRGEHLVRADRAFATGGGTLAKLATPAFAKLLDETGRIASIATREWAIIGQSI